MVTWILWAILYTDDGMWPVTVQAFQTKAECVASIPQQPQILNVQYQCIPNVHIDHEGKYSLE